MKIEDVTDDQIEMVDAFTVFCQKLIKLETNVKGIKQLFRLAYADGFGLMAIAATMAAKAAGELHDEKKSIDKRKCSLSKKFGKKGERHV